MLRFSDKQLLEISSQMAVGAPLPVFKEKAPARRLESIAQCSVIEWWDVACRLYRLPARALKHVPNGGQRNARTGALLKKEGVRAGALDLLLTVASFSSHGLWIEMKAPNGVVSSAQKDEIKHLRDEGFCTAVCFSARDAIATIEAYLKERLT